MLTLYLGLLIGGGVLLLLPLVGLDGADESADDAASTEDGVASWLPFGSMRFWSFATTFGGLCGALLTAFRAPAALCAFFALAVGIGTGWGITRALSQLRKGSVDGSYTEEDFAGAPGRVLLPVTANAPAGRVRIRVAGRDVDRPAVTEDRSALLAGQSVVVWRVQSDGTVVVTATDPALASV